MVTKANMYVEFSKFENILEEYFSKYEGRVLNEIEVFENLNPSMENLGKIFYKDVSELLATNDFFLKSLEISENPTRTFIISD